MIDIAILDRLNAPAAEERLENLRVLLPEAGFPPAVPQYINNHIHTTYSFSPYSPTAAVYAARAEGLCTAGIIDHDSIAGAREFLAAAEMVGMPATIGMECRVDMTGTRLEGRRTNNPDQVGISYMTIQSVPHDRIDLLDRFFAPFREARNQRNRAMVERINTLLPETGLDFDRDVLPLSMAAGGGGVTERHLMYALAKKLTAGYGRGEGLTAKLEEMGLALSEKQRAQRDPLSHVQTACPLDTVEPFVPGKGKHIDIHGFHIHRQRPRGLGDIGQKAGALFPGPASYLPDILHGAGHIGAVVYDHQTCVPGNGSLHGFHIHITAPVAAHFHRKDPPCPDFLFQAVKYGT